MKKKTPLVHRSVDNIPRLRFVGYVPKWMKEFVIEVRRVLVLEDFHIEVRYGDFKSMNKIVRREDPHLELLTKDDAGMALIDAKYLTAKILFVKPFNLCRTALRKITHEFLHTFLTYKVFSRVRHELTDHFIDSELDPIVYSTLLNIEERACEHLTNVLENVGFFDRHLPARA